MTADCPSGNMVTRVSFAVPSPSISPAPYAPEPAPYAPGPAPVSYEPITSPPAPFAMSPGDDVPISSEPVASPAVSVRICLHLLFYCSSSFLSSI